MPESTLTYTIIKTISAPLVAGVAGYLDNPFITALLFGAVTKIMLHIFDRQLKKVALKIRNQAKGIVKWIKSFKK